MTSSEKTATTVNTTPSVLSANDLLINPDHIKDDPKHLLVADPGELIVLKELEFYGNAALLKPTARYQLEELVGILKKHPNLNITIHGHTNGDFRGEIIKMGKKDKDYFHTSSKNDFIKGDAFQLSVERARLIKSYLEKSGILSGRINTIGWGGVKPLYPTGSPEAIHNSRVEIEITSR